MQKNWFIIFSVKVTAGAYSMIAPECPVENGITAVKGKVTAKVKMSVNVCPNAVV